MVKKEYIMPGSKDFITELIEQIETQKLYVICNPESGSGTTIVALYDCLYSALEEAA